MKEGTGMNAAELEAARAALAEIRREIKMRERVYPRLVMAGKLTTTAANDRIRDMREAEALVGALVAGAAPAPEQGLLFPGTNPLEGR